MDVQPTLSNGGRLIDFDGVLLPVRIVNPLRHHYRTVAEVAAADDEEVAAKRGIGTKALAVIRAVIPYVPSRPCAPQLAASPAMLLEVWERCGCEPADPEQLRMTHDYSLLERPCGGVGRWIDGEHWVSRLRPVAEVLAAAKEES